ncbi:hypothetical protein B0H13DRAFT_2485145 [Mycena leptocephala]|nr:hypothetical protein B0H13DRAFT_2485145 [Mycena leptocephala]
MLLLLILVHLLSRNGSAAPVPHTLNNRSNPDSCDDINNCRKLFDIVWGCLATIFACTWVSMHPNVPAPNQSWLALFWRRLKMMLIAVVAPELMVGFAARQFFAAWTLSKGGSASSQLSDNLAFISSTEFDFSKIHGFFFCMGGFVSSTGYPIVTKEQLADSELGLEFLVGIKNVEAKDITDKSKGDVLSKGLAMMQGLWFAAQCLARVHQRLAVTELEVATLAFAVVNVFIWLLWWDKPLDVQRQIVVGPAKPPDVQPISAVRIPLYVRFYNVILGIANYYDYNSPSSTSVPSFWSLPTYELDDLKGFFLPFAIEALVVIVFGSIHCAAWNADFSTTVEMWMWRSCSSLVVAIPAVFLILGKLTAVIDVDWEAALHIGLYAPIPIYVIARLVLIILPLVALRSLPPGALMEVTWSVYIPHL